MHRRIAFVRSAGAAISAGIVGRATTCTPQQSEDEMKGLVQVSGLKPAWFADLKRNNLGTVVELMSISNGALKLDPPDGATVGTIFAGLRSSSACSGDDAWPLDADAMAVTTAKSKLAILCRYAQPLYAKAVERLARVEVRRAAGEPRASERATHNKYKCACAVVCACVRRKIVSCVTFTHVCGYDSNSYRVWKWVETL